MTDYIQTLTIICSAAILHFAWNHVFRKTQSKLNNSDFNKLTISLITATRKPFAISLWATAILLSLISMSETTGVNPNHYLPTWPSILFFITLLAITNRWAPKFQENYEKGDRSTNISGISKVISAVLLLIIIFTVMDAAGVDYSNALTLGGIGTLAIGFAGKDILSNILSSVALHLEKHINIGDYIKTRDGINGEIYKIGWRATTIITPAQTPIYVPNSLLNQQPLENVSRNSHRNVRFVWTFKINQTEEIAQFCDEGSTYLGKLPCIDQRKTTVCLIHTISERGVDVFINFNLRTHDWEMYLRQKHQVAYHLINIAESMKAEFAVAKVIATKIDYSDSITNVLEEG